MGMECEEKREFRRKCAALRDGMDPLLKKEADRVICSRLSALACYRFAPVILLYSPIKSEVDIRPLLRDTLRRGKVVGLPLCEKEPGVMTFRKIDSLSSLSPGAYGVAEPSEDAPILQKELLASNTLVVVPALAFDKEGYRLGYGKGFYDRFLNGFHGLAVGVTYKTLIFDRLPRGFYDRKVSLIVSEGGAVRTDA